MKTLKTTSLYFVLLAILVSCTGDFEDVKFGRPLERKDDVQMTFDVTHMGYGGELTINKRKVFLTVLICMSYK